MPKYKQKAITTPPPIDWLWAAVLERKVQYGLDLQTMANIAGVSYGVFRNLWRKSPWEWPRKVRENICEAFNLELKFGSANVKVKENSPWGST